MFRRPGAQDLAKNVTLLQMTAQLSNVDCHAEFVLVERYEEGYIFCCDAGIECQKDTKWSQL